jgi:hypothetical protein
MLICDTISESYIEEEQTTQWSNEKEQMDNQRSTKHTYKGKNRVIRTPLKTGVDSGAPERSVYMEQNMY